MMRLYIPSLGRHQKRSYRRYAIVHEGMLRESAEKLARLGEFQARSVPFSVPSMPPSSPSGV